ncbi:TetR/AcrR family transcriptional regulator C-terminal ligand-binding domain-containing protein [Streptomyces sp. NPDC091215]|uniref:TetR/AcrR family transcriptional regulator C-terminal ligand-binding domain-containing protein n=1 Tax=Streptomyces sp. NPDC091215 TaxID=3155192 RepID=UPI003443D9D9
MVVLGFEHQRRAGDPVRDTRHGVRLGRLDQALAEGLDAGVTAPRRAAARAILQGAIDRGELPTGLDLDLGTDLLIAPLAFRVLVIQGSSDDEYLETLTNAIEAALRAAVR